MFVSVVCVVCMLCFNLLEWRRALFIPNSFCLCLCSVSFVLIGFVLRVFVFVSCVRTCLRGMLHVCVYGCVCVSRFVSMLGVGVFVCVSDVVEIAVVCIILLCDMFESC